MIGSSCRSAETATERRKNSVSAGQTHRGRGRRTGQGQQVRIRPARVLKVETVLFEQLQEKKREGRKVSERDLEQLAKNTTDVRVGTGVAGPSDVLHERHAFP